MQGLPLKGLAFQVSRDDFEAHVLVGESLAVPLEGLFDLAGGGLAHKRLARLPLLEQAQLVVACRCQDVEPLLVGAGGRGFRAARFHRSAAAWNGLLSLDHQTGLTSRILSSSSKSLAAASASALPGLNRCRRTPPEDHSAWRACRSFSRSAHAFCHWSTVWKYGTGYSSTRSRNSPARIVLCEWLRLTRNVISVGPRTRNRLYAPFQKSVMRARASSGCFSKPVISESSWSEVCALTETR